MDDPRSVLGVGPDATDADVRRARRRLARTLHPDLHTGADRADAERRMALVNQAADLLLGRERPAAPAPDPAGAADDPVFADAAFAIDALPVDAFEAVLLAAVNLGDVIRAEEPYFLAALLDDPGPCQCVLELVPDAGATTVTFEIFPRHFGRCPTERDVRDALVAEITRQQAEM
ncbi:MAG: DnaJ domain-containing protein [Acidimicrobiales bacterium]